MSNETPKPILYLLQGDKWCLKLWGIIKEMGTAPLYDIQNIRAPYRMPNGQVVYPRHNDGNIISQVPALGIYREPLRFCNDVFKYVQTNKQTFDAIDTSGSLFGDAGAPLIGGNEQLGGNMDRSEIHWSQGDQITGH